MPAVLHRADRAQSLAAFPAWVTWTIRVLTLAGVAVATYLTVVHYDTKVALLCPESSTINCAEVTTSPESLVFGVPVAVLGLAYYAIQAVLAWLPRRVQRRAFEVVRLVLAIGAMGFVLYLVWAEVVRIGAICLWCTSVHAITLVVLLVLAYAWVTYRPSAQGG
jgi:uncharacterized membrane protein